MPTRTPVVLVHGNGTTASCWDGTVAALRDRGYSDTDLWTIDFKGATPSHPEMAEQLDAYIDAILDATGADDVDIVAHSLGVTGARWWLFSCDGHRRTNRFVSLAGANHGLTTATWAARLGFSFGPWSPSAWLRADYDSIDGHPLRALNQDETLGDVDYYTIRGSWDELFALDPDSPRLCGAEENVVLDEGHNGLLTSSETIDRLDSWLSPQRATPTLRE